MAVTFPKLTISIFLSLTLTAWSGNSYSEHKIANIEEASGIDYCENSDTLIVANDEGSFYEITRDGESVARHKVGTFDLEGVVCEKEYIMFAVETGSLLKVDRTSLKSEELKLKGKPFKLSKKNGIEGITKVGSHYYLSIQNDRKKDAKMLIVKAGDNYANVIDTVDLGVIDAAGMHHHNDKLYIVSDTKDKLYIYDLKKEEITKKMKLPKFHQEGITFDNQGYVYLADDQGAVLKYKAKELKLKIK